MEEAVKHLNDFDLRYEFGPCLALTRSERYHRALRFGLNPPKSVIDVIERFRLSNPCIEEK